MPFYNTVFKTTKLCMDMLISQFVMTPKLPNVLLALLTFEEFHRRVVLVAISQDVSSHLFTQQLSYPHSSSESLMTYL